MNNEIKQLIPHREPFLFVDSLDQADETIIIGRRRFTEKDFFFQGHFPDYPIVPGVIIVEAMAQCGGAGVITNYPDAKNKLLVLAAVEKAKFRNPVVPGDELRFEIENIHVDARAVRQRGKAYLGDKVAAEAQWLCMIRAQ